jgi:hypothetical protein
MAILRPHLLTRRHRTFPTQHGRSSLCRCSGRERDGCIPLFVARIWAYSLTRSGSIPFLIVYFAGGLFGNILGGNFSRVGIPSVGASGALVAVVSCCRVSGSNLADGENACVAVDLMLHWKYEERPKLKVCPLLPSPCDCRAHT